MWVGFHPTFSRQSKANKFPLVFWLNENVGFAFVLSPWHSLSKLSLLLIWLIENVGFVFVLSPWHSLSKLSLCSSGLTKTLALPSFYRHGIV